MTTAEQKEIAKNFLTMVTSGQIEEAYQQYVDMNGKHHNIFTPAGFAALEAGMAEHDDETPDKTLNIMHLVSEGDVVIAHSHLVIKPGDTGMIVMHVLRFSNGKIVEFWDCGQPIGDTPVNTDGPF